MKKQKLYRILLIVTIAMALASFCLVAAAAGLTGDISGDGKITVFDAQMLAEYNAGKRTLTDEQLAASGNLSIRELLFVVLGGNLGCTDSDGDGVYEITSADGLTYVAQHPKKSYILQNDIDMQGADWTPIAGFAGSFDGNGKTISNFTVNTSVPDSAASGIHNQGFFGDTTADAVISNLHLKDVTVTAAADTTAMGFFVGCLRGELTGCTAVGALQDTRESYPADMYTGVFVGKMLYGYDATITGGTSISFTDEYDRYTTNNLCANAKVLIENETVNLGSAYPGKVGLAGYADASHTVTGQWVDTSHSSRLLSQVLQDRRQTVVDYMNAMATVEWTPTSTLVYTAANGTDQTIVAGKVHVGLPYNFHNGSYERFLSSMDTQGANGVWTADASLESCGWDSSVANQYYIRPYTSTSAQLGAGIQVTGLDENATVVAVDGNGFVYYPADGKNYYYGIDAQSEYLHMIGNAATEQCMRLYDVSGSTPVPLQSPVTGIRYKLGAEDTSGTIWFFNGKSNLINGANSLITTQIVGNARDVYLESVDGGYYLRFDEQGVWSDTGFYLTMGNACNTSVSWAWKQVSSVFVNDNSRRSGFGYEGGFNPRGAQGMIPTDYNRSHYGMYPIGDWAATAIDSTGKVVSAEWDPSKAAYSCTDEIYTPQILNNNGIDTLYEAYAQTHKADALTCYVSDWTAGNPGPGGHVRMVVADPVVIRDAYGVIDGKASYLLETEQGVGFSRENPDFPSTWAYAKRYSFYSMLGSPSEMPTPLSTKTYLPMTIRALQEEYLPESFTSEIRKSTIDGAIPAISPTEGLIYSSHTINSVILTVKDSSDGSLIYTYEAFAGVSADTAVSGANNNRLYMADLHAQPLYHAIAAGTLTPGSTYSYTVEAKLSTGQIIPLFAEERTFTCPALP